VARIDVSPVEVDIAAAVAMLAGIEERATSSRLVDLAERAARDGLAGITGVPRDTGELAGSFDVRRDGDVVEIVNTAPYARFVFRGTRHMDAQPPNVPVDLIARQLAADVAREVFR
jgi:hypothetical protein